MPFQLPPGEGATRHLYRVYEWKATKRSLCFTISLEAFKNLIHIPCYYCGLQPEQTLQKYPGFIYIGVDRIDNRRGYEPGNVVSCCKICNAFKSSRTTQEFLNHVNRIADFQRMKRTSQWES